MIYNYVYLFNFRDFFSFFFLSDIRGGGGGGQKKEGKKEICVFL